MFTAALSATAAVNILYLSIYLLIRIWEQLICLLTDKWLSKLQHTIHAVWVNLKVMMLSERSQAKISTYCMILFA